MLHNDSELSKQAAEAIIASFLDATDEDNRQDFIEIHHLRPLVATLEFITDGLGGSVESMVDSLHRDLSGGELTERSGDRMEDARERLKAVLDQLA